MREAFTHNLLLKLMSFALAVVLWALVAEEQNVEESAEVYLDLKRHPDLILLNPPSSSISIRVIGPRSKLKALRSSHLELPVDLARAKPGEMVYNFVGQRIRNLPSGVEVTAYSPGSLRLQFDERMLRKLPVRVQTEGEPAPGYQVTSVEAEPSSLTIEGPRDEVKLLRDVQTEAVRLTGINKSVDARYPLVFHSPNVHVVGGKEDVAVKVQLVPIIEERQIEGVEIVVPETMGKCLLTPDSAKVVLEGPREALQAIQPTDVRIFLQEGTIPLTQLHDVNILRYPATGERKGLPHLLVSWPREDVVKLKRISPASFELKVFKGSGAPKPGG